VLKKVNNVFPDSDAVLGRDVVKGTTDNEREELMKRVTLSGVLLS